MLQGTVIRIGRWFGCGKRIELAGDLGEKRRGWLPTIRLSTSGRAWWTTSILVSLRMSWQESMKALFGR